MPSILSVFFADFLFRFLSPSQNSSFYGQRHYPPYSPEQNLPTTHSLLESISCTLSNVQRQLSAIQEDNVERDVTMKKILQEIDDLKNKPPLPVTDPPKSSRSRKSPRGLSVSVACRLCLPDFFA
jgi:hypothetical protein